jgi:adenylylsulfate kinase-like enzyme
MNHLDTLEAESIHMLREVAGAREHAMARENASLATCEARDPKGRYRKARSGARS